MHTKLELYQRVTPLAGLGIFERNYVTGEFYWNTVIRQILEVDEFYSPELEASLNFYKYPELIRKLIAEAITSGLPESAQLEITTGRNNHKWVKVRIQADCEHGKCTRLYGTLEDVTENIRLLNLLKERERRFANAFDYAPIGMALVELNGGWIKVNQSLCRSLGYNETEFLNKTFQDFTHPEDLDADLSKLQKLLDGSEETYSMEKRYFHKDGRIIWALLNVSLIRNDAEEPLYFVSQIKDITERKKNTDTIREQNSRLLNFAHIVSHNLRSHTGNMQMLTNMILVERDADEKEKLIKMLNGNAGSLLETLDNLNEVVKVHDSGQSDKTELQLAQEVQRVVEILSPTIMLNHAELLQEIPEDAVVEFNPAYLESILINLVSNALKYRQPDVLPKIRIFAKLMDGHVTLSIADNGLGIDLTLHGHKLFGMYKTFHRHPDARGMGLFLVKNQVEAMGGYIWAESQPGQGATFTIKFA